MDGLSAFVGSILAALSLAKQGVIGLGAIWTWIFAYRKTPPFREIPMRLSSTNPKNELSIYRPELAAALHTTMRI